MSTKVNSQSAGSTFFVGSDVDDAGLNVFQFRILGHLHRRAGLNGQAWPSVQSIAEHCGIGVRVVRRTLAELVALGHLTARQRAGQSTLYSPSWCASAATKPASPPLSHRTGPPLANRIPEGIPKKELPTTTARAVAPSPPPDDDIVVVVGEVEEKGTAGDDVSETLAGFGIIAAKREALRQSGLTARETRRICRKVEDGGGRAGAMILQLEEQAERKRRGLPLVGGIADRLPTPKLVPPTWESEPLTAEESAEIVAELRKFRRAGCRLSA